ncbi:hypothetical protein MY11210_007611 [Beauveria gryllotalpidicola]
MDLPSRFGLLALQVKDYLRENVEPHLTVDEHLTYLEDHKVRIKFAASTIYPGNHILVKSPKPETATVLDAIIGQAIFGRDTMMKRDWFRFIYSRHAARLDSLPKRMVHELRQMRNEFFGKERNFSSRTTMHTIAEIDSPLLTPTVSDTPSEIPSEIPSNTPSDTPSDNSSNFADDLLALLSKQNEETTELDKKHEAELDKQNEEKIDLNRKHEAELNKQNEETIDLNRKHEAELRKHFYTAVEKYPGLSGVLCGVQHSFRDRADRSSERRTLINATMEYIARNGP